MLNFSLENFISKNITKRNESLFKKDIDLHSEEIQKQIENKTMLVIGGAGSIGSSFIKACLPFKPKSLVVVDLSENGLAELTRDLRSSNNLYVPDDYITYPINFADDVFKKMFKARGGFDVVANFSAHKHVRSEKDVYSVEALLRNNVLNARKLMELLKENPPENFFCVSTDKAANPVNVMGVSKRAMEDLIFSYSDFFPVKTARFANVAFSNGSLPAGFLERINKSQPISAPSDVKRYFVSPKESGEICMLACMLGKNREIYFPKLDELSTMSFSEIAELLLKEKGFSILKCNSEQEAKQKADELLSKGKNEYPVFFSSSDTSGEKAYEEFFTEKESVDLDRFKSLGVIVDVKKRPLNEVNSFMEKLADELNNPNMNKANIVSLLKDFIPNFEHIEKNKHLDEKM